MDIGYSRRWGNINININVTSHINPLFSRLHCLKASDKFWAHHLRGRSFSVHTSTWSGRQRTCVTNYIDQQTLIEARQRLCSALSTSLDIRRTRLSSPLSATECFLSQPLVCGTVFHRMPLLPPLYPSSAVALNHISSHFLIPLSDSSLTCTVPAQ